MNIYDDPITTMAFNWFTTSNTTGEQVEVSIGTGTFTPFKTVTVNATTPQNVHKAVVTGLTPNTKYSFRVGKAGLWSNIGTFTTAKDNKDPFSFIYVTDSQVGDFNILQTNCQAAFTKYPNANFWLHCGDLSWEGHNQTEHIENLKLFFSKHTSLQELQASENKLTQLDVTNCTSLQILICYDNNLTELNITNCTQLYELDCSHNCLAQLNVTNCTQLKTLLCNNNLLSILDVTNCMQLQDFECGANLLSKLDVTNCTQLKILGCNRTQLTEFDITNCTQLTHLFCNENHLIELDVTNCTQLQILWCYESSLTNLVLTYCTQLQGLHCQGNRLTELDLTGLNKLTDFYGNNQGRDLVLYKNETGEYFHYISLNNPTFLSNAISYSGGILISTDNTVNSTYFTVETNKQG